MPSSLPTCPPIASVQNQRHLEPWTSLGGQLGGSVLAGRALCPITHRRAWHCHHLPAFLPIIKLIFTPLLSHGSWGGRLGRQGLGHTKRKMEQGQLQLGIIPILTHIHLTLLQIFFKYFKKQVNLYVCTFFLRREAHGFYQILKGILDLKRGQL